VPREREGEGEGGREGERWRERQRERERERVKERGRRGKERARVCLPRYARNSYGKRDLFIRQKRPIHTVYRRGEGGQERQRITHRHTHRHTHSMNKEGTKKKNEEARRQEPCWYLACWYLACWYLASTNASRVSHASAPKLTCVSSVPRLH
jgi:hypothetical protein